MGNRELGHSLFKDQDFPRKGNFYLDQLVLEVSTLVLRYKFQ